MASLADLPLPRLLQELRNMGIPHDALDKLSATEEGIRTLRGLFKPGGPFQSAPKASSNDELSSDVFRSALDGAKARYDKEKDMKPTKQVLAPRQMILEAANTARNKIQPTKGTGETMQVISIAGVPKNFSTTPLDRLERAAIKDLFTYKVHKGQYVLLRIISPPNRILAVSFAVEDPNGDAVMLSAYNLSVNHYNGPELDLLYPLGSILAVREPNFKSPALGGSGMLRLDTPTDLIFLSETDPILEDIRWKYASPKSPFGRDCDYKVEGNKYYAKKDYVVAESIYSQGLRRNPPKDQQILLHLNRSAAQNQLTNFASAGRDAAYVLQSIEESDEPDSKANMKLKEKASFRLANSQYGQRKFPLAKSTFITLLQNFPTSQQAEEGIAKCEAREKESATGEYDFLEMYRAGKKGGAVRFDIGDYQGPVKSEQIATRGGGRGMVATRNIRAGDLISVEKAFLATFPEDLDPRFPIVSIDMVRSSVSFTTTVGQVIRIAQKVADDPSLETIVNSLYAGPNAPLPTTTLEEPIVKGFGVDVTRIEEVGIFNAFDATSHNASKDPISAPTTALRLIGNADSPSALFPLASIFNHDCSPSALWRIYGDVIVVRATRDIALGKEIFIGYAMGDFEPRTEVLITHFGEKGCACALCKADGEDGEELRRKRSKILDVDKRLLDSVLADSHAKRKVSLMKKAIVKIQKYIDDLNSTYSPKRNLFRPQMARAYHALAEEYRLLGQYDACEAAFRKANKAQFDSLVAVGVKVLDDGESARRGFMIDISCSAMFSIHVIQEAGIAIAGTYMLIDETKKANAWISTVLKLEDLASGGGKPFFRELFMDQWKLFKFPQEQTAMIS